MSEQSLARELREGPGRSWPENRPGTWDLLSQVLQARWPGDASGQERAAGARFRAHAQPEHEFLARIFSIFCSEKHLNFELQLVDGSRDYISCIQTLVKRATDLEIV